MTASISNSNNNSNNHIGSGPRLLWLTEHYYPHGGGMAQSCERIVEGLRQNGLIIDLLHLTRRSRRNPRSEGLSGINLRWPLSDSPAHGLNLLWNWLENRVENRLENNIEYSGIVAFGAQHAPIAALNFSRWLDLPLYTMVRGNDFDTGIFDIRKRGFLQELYESSKIVFCVSTDKVNKIKKLFPKTNALWVGNGIDCQDWIVEKHHLELTRQLSSDFPDNKKVIGLFGHLKEKKGGLFLLDSIKKSGLLHKLHLLIVGELSVETSEWLAKEENGISHTLVSFLPRDQLIPYYLSCDCIAIPSYYDGTPNVLLEAGVLGIPVLASNVAGMRDVLQEGKRGVLFSAGNFHQLRYALESLVSGDYEEWKALAAKLKIYIEEYITVEKESGAYTRAFFEGQRGIKLTTVSAPEYAEEQPVVEEQ